MIVKTIAELAPYLSGESRLLALDVGEKTIGIAVSDVRRSIATPYYTIRRGKFTVDIEKLKKTLAEFSAAAVVVGFPVNMDGSFGPRCQSIMQFAKNLKTAVELPILLWDERMSTMAVTRTMLDADMSRARRAELVDKLAAAYILQGVLDGLQRV